jgi:O-antigen ligase
LVFGVALSLPFWLLLTQQFRSLFTPLLSVLGRDATFTGRADIWEHIDASTVNPIVGAGFWNFWGGKGGAAISAAMQTGVPNAHSGYLDIYLDGGLIGLVLLFLLLLTTGNRLVRDARRSRFDRLKFALLTVAVVVNLTESNFARPSLIWFTTVLAMLQFVPLLRSKRRPIMQLQSEQAMSELPANLF